MSRIAQLVLMRLIAHAAHDRRGVSGAEYAILAVGVVIVVGSAVVVLGDPFSGAFAVLARAISSTQDSLGQ
jgi:Flp pilus assembly pilin Flp